jgi:hypothetical protein
MDKKLSGKGYIRGGEGRFLTSTGDLYHYHDGALTPEAAWPSPSPEPKPDQNHKGVIEMSYQGMFELQPLYDRHQSFHGKAFVERWSTENGTQLVLKSYGTVAAKVTPAVTWHDGQEAFRVEIGMEHLSVTTLRHVKEFLAQTDDVFKGVTLPWLRKAVKNGNPIDGAGTAWRKVYVLNEL